MESLVIDDKQFVKASKIARDFGYTADYIGQLCRAGKVNAELVGRSWYVEADSLENHRRGRYQKMTIENSEPQIGYDVDIHHAPSRKAVHRATKTSLLSVPTPSTSKPTPSVSPQMSTEEKRFYSRVSKPVTMARYSPDEMDLIPTVRKPERAIEQKSAEIEVDLADANPVAIKSQSTPVIFTATKRPKLKFTGSVSVGVLPDTDLIEMPEPIARNTETKETRNSITTKQSKRLVKSQQISDQKLAMVKIAHTKGGGGHKKTIPGTLAVQKTKPTASPSRWWLIPAFGVTAGILVISLLSLHQEIIIDSGNVESQTVFRAENLSASLKNGLK